MADSPTADEAPVTGESPATGSQAASDAQAASGSPVAAGSLPALRQSGRSQSGRSQSGGAAFGRQPCWLGWDLGGANLKAASGCGQTGARGFALWRHPDRLADQMVQMAAELPPASVWAITMTGEMADTFPDRAVGVGRILQQADAAARRWGVDRIEVYAWPGCFLSPAEACQAVDRVASANWHALALWAARSVGQPALLIDIGGTTTDIVPLLPGRVASEAQTDFDRLGCGQLVYVGSQRTAVASLVQRLPFEGADVPVMREVFANMDDCQLVLQLTAEAADDGDSCDGQPRTRAAAANRLARMIGLDRRRVSIDQARPMAAAVLAAACGQIAEAIAGQPAEFQNHWIVSGHGSTALLPALLRRFQPHSVRRLDQLPADVLLDGCLSASDCSAAPLVAGATALAAAGATALARVAPAYACARLAMLPRSALLR